LRAEGFMQVADCDRRVTAEVLSVVLSRRVLFDRFHDGFRAQFVNAYGKNMIMSFTKTTSARITNNEERTTELVAARPTPAAPPSVRIP